MNYQIKKYAVQHPQLKQYIKFYWRINVDHMQVDHKIIPVRNIDLKFNLSDTPHYLHLDGETQTLENVYFSGLRDHYRQTRLQFDGRADVLGICFLPEGFYPFLKMPVSEFRNRLLGAAEMGFKGAGDLRSRLVEAPDMSSKITLLEKELVKLLDGVLQPPAHFKRIFHALHKNDSPVQISDFCKEQYITPRTLERMYNKYIGVSPRAYARLYRFQNSVNQISGNDFVRLSDIAYDNGYFDQMHFIKEFKRFTGYTPKTFVQKKDSLLHIGKMS